MTESEPQSSHDGNVWTILLFRCAAVIFLLSAIFFPTTEYKVLSIATGLLGVFLLILSWSIEGTKTLADQKQLHRPAIDLLPVLERLDQIEAALERHSLGITPPPINAQAPVNTQTITEDLLGELKAAQDVADPLRVLQIRDALVDKMPVEPLKEIDSQLAKWFMGLIMKRLRTGHVSAELAELVGQVSERFVQTHEGASLRASLPTLRRSAGLCARCSRPYRGIADACPICLAGPALTTAPSESEEEVEEVEKLTRPEESLFIDPIG